MRISRAINSKQIHLAISKCTFSQLDGKMSGKSQSRHIFLVPTVVFKVFKCSQAESMIVERKTLLAQKAV